MVIKDESTQARVGPARRSAPPVSGRWVWLAAFAAVATLLLARSPFLFTTRLYETADEAANSILVLQAMHFTLLHGNYSLEGFFHPGPAYLYVMAAGQWLFRDVMHIVPTPWNGQLIAILLLNSAEVATVAWIVYRWAGSVWAAAVTVALVIGLAAAVDVNVPAVINRDILGANWMPDLYVPTFLAFVVAAASVAAGPHLAPGGAGRRRLARDPRARRVPVLRAPDRRRGGRRGAVAGPARAVGRGAPVPSRPEVALRPGPGHQRALRAADRG